MHMLSSRLVPAEERFMNRKKYLRKLPNTAHWEKKIEEQREDKILGCV